jgi:putative photosynthetic complex assembly protein 2
VADLAIPGLFAGFLWWLSTGVIAYLDGLPRRTFRRSFLGATALAAAGAAGVAWSAGETSALAGYAAFTSALLLWGWLEMAFLLGVLTGPRRGACPPDASGWRRAAMATEVILWNELAILAGLVLLAVALRDAPNAVALWTFGLLWAFRASAKLNLFLGVRNLGEEFLPDHLRHVETYLRRRPMNPLMPVSLAAIAAAAWFLAAAASEPGAPPHAAAGHALLAVLAALALLEHALMVLPLSPSALWSWYLGRRRAGADAPQRRAPGPAPAQTIPWRRR